MCVSVCVSVSVSVCVCSHHTQLPYSIIGLDKIIILKLSNGIAPDVIFLIYIIRLIKHQEEERDRLQQIKKDQEQKMMKEKLHDNDEL